MKTETSNLEKLLTDSRADQYFTRSFVLRFEVLVHLTSGNGTLASIARRHGISRQAVHKYAAAARRIFGIPSTPRLTRSL
jgi:transposase-like protein